MAVFKLKTKNQVNIDKKPRVYFTCHPDDFEKYFDKICEDIFKTHDCAIYYTEDMSEKIAEDEKEVDLGRNNLFVVPITFKLLTTRNRTLDEDIPYALKKHIPVLPIMVESGIDEIYMRPDKFGEMQYLSMYGADVTAIAYEEKLKKYLESVLISDEMAKRVRAAFDAYIFLSYRKKDRKYANELMKLIHSNSECRDIAIWFDEFLIPGESFKETIEKMLDDCDLFTLLITPRLLEKIVDEKGEKQDNYVVSNELPLARKNKDEKGTEIFAVEMEKTDREGLATLEIYDYFSTEDKAFKERLLAATSKIAVSSNNTPEHDFLIGLAYLEGIDVEVNVDLAIELIMNSAEKGLKEALKKMVDIYYVGQSVPKCINKAASYQKKLVEILKPEKLLEDDEKLFAYLKEELYLAKLELDAGLLKEARNTCWRVIKLCRGNGGYGQFFSNNRIEYYIHAYVLLGDIFGAREDIIQSKECYDKAVKNLQELPLESRHVEFNYAYGLLYYKFGCIYSSKEFYDYRYIIESYEKAIDFFYDCDQQTDVIEKNVNYCLIKLAAEFERNSSKTSKAFDIYLKLSRICDEDNEDDSHKISIASYAFFKLGELYVDQKNEKAALESYEKSIDLANKVVKEFKNNVEVMKILLIASVKKIKLDNNIAEKDISLERIIESAENLYKEVPSKTSAQLLADVYLEAFEYKTEYGILGYKIYQKLDLKYPKAYSQFFFTLRRSFWAKRILDKSFFPVVELFFTGKTIDGLQCFKQKTLNKIHKFDIRFVACSSLGEIESITVTDYFCRNTESVYISHHQIEPPSLCIQVCEIDASNQNELIPDDCIWITYKNGITKEYEICYG